MKTGLYAQDTDFDLVGDGAVLGLGFQEFTVPIIGIGDELFLNAFIQMDSGFESVGLDNFFVSPGPPPNTTLFAWQNGTNSLYQVDTTPPPTATLIGGPNVDFAAEIEYGGGVIYGGNANLQNIDPATGMITNSIPATFPLEGNRFTALEFVGATLYAGLSTSNAPGGPSFLSTVDTETGVLTVVGATGVSSPLGGLAFDVDAGVMYGISSGGSAPELFTIDLATGAATSVGLVNIGGTVIDGTTALEFGDDGILYALTNVSSPSTTGHLFAVDPLTGNATDLGDTGQAGLVALTLVESDPEFEWLPDTIGDWNKPSNWSSLSVPNDNRAQVLFGDVITFPRTVVTDSAVTAKSITFDSTVGYAIAGQGEVYLDAVIGDAKIEVIEGQHDFQTRVALDSNTMVDVASGATLEFNHRLALSGNTLTKTGLGTLNVNNIVNMGGGGALVVSEGVVRGAGTIGGDVVNEGGTISPGVTEILSVVPEPASATLLLFVLLGFVAGFRPTG